MASTAENAQKWDLWHTLINTVKFAKGVPLSTAKNPYRREQDESVISNGTGSSRGSNSVID